MPGLTSRLDHWITRSVPLGVSLGVAMLGAIPWPLAGAASVAPSLPIIVVLFWVLHRPSAFPPLFAFLVGLVHDLITGAPLGLNAFAAVIVHALAVRLRPHLVRCPFLTLWAAFVPLVFVASFGKWMLASLHHLAFVGLDPVVMQGMVTVLAFPPTMWLLGRVDLLLTDDDSEPA